MTSMSAPSRRFFYLFYEHTITACRHDRYRIKAPQQFHSSCIPPYEARHASLARVLRPQTLHQRAQRSASYTTTPCADETASSKDTLEPQSTQDEPLNEQMRAIMRRVPHPVVVITSGPAANTNNPTAPDETSQSMTVSSFNTVCLHPSPIISFNTKVPSRTLDQINERNGLFFVNFLASGGKAAALAHEFAGRHVSHTATGTYLAMLEERPDELNREMHAIVRSNDQTWRGSLARARCRLLPDMTVKIGDHRIVVAEVEDVQYGARFTDKTASPYNMLYANGRYLFLSRQTFRPLKLDIRSHKKESNDAVPN